MKKLTSILILTLFSFCVEGQVFNDTTLSGDYSHLEFRCGVAHLTKDGGFSCDMKGTYYPFYIKDSTINKWFIKMVNNDSLFYYRSYRTDIYVWNKKSKKGNYGYFCGDENGGITIADEYNGKDTLRITEQVWSPNPPLIDTSITAAFNIELYKGLCGMAQDSMNLYHDTDLINWTKHFFIWKGFSDSLLKYIYVRQSEIKQELKDALMLQQLERDINELVGTKPEPIN